MNAGFWSQSVIHRILSRTVKCVFLYSTEKNAILAIIVFVGLIFFLISSKYQFVQFFFLYYINSITLFCCSFLQRKENWVKSLAGENWMRRTLSKWQCRIFLVFTPSVFSHRNWHSWAISMFTIYKIPDMNSFFWKLYHLLCVSHGWSQVTTNAILLSLVWEAGIAYEMCRILACNPFR